MSEHATGQALLDGRESVYGERVKNMQDVAQVWSGILGTEVRPDQVPLLMAGYKLVRASGTPDYSDNIDDVEGYALMFREVIGDKMINAKSVKEYLELKNPQTFDDIIRGSQESEEDRIERQHEERAYGRSMGLKKQTYSQSIKLKNMKRPLQYIQPFASKAETPASTYHARSNDYETAQLAKRIKEILDLENSFIYGHEKAAQHAAGVAMRYFMPYITELAQENRLLEREIESKS